MAKFITVIKPGSKDAGETSRVFPNWENQTAAHFVVNVNSGGNLVVDINGYDEISDNDYTILTSSALGAGVNILRVGPDLTAGANVAKDYMPAYWRVVTTLSGATDYSISASVI